MTSLSRIWRLRTTRCSFPKAKDECGTMRDELKKGASQEEGVRGRKEGAESGLELAPECLGKQKRSEYMIALLSSCGIQDKRRGISGGGTSNPNKPNRLKFWWVNQIDGFRPKQSRAIYLPCYQLDTGEIRAAFETNAWS
jgi:hypothetical protein